MFGECLAVHTQLDDEEDNGLLPHELFRLVVALKPSKRRPCTVEYPASRG